MANNGINLKNVLLYIFDGEELEEKGEATREKGRNVGIFDFKGCYFRQIQEMIKWNIASNFHVAQR
jgi:hypothetical protein